MKNFKYEIFPIIRFIYTNDRKILKNRYIYIYKSVDIFCDMWDFYV